MTVEGPPDEPPRPAPTRSDLTVVELAREILPNASTMIGVCVTFVGLAKLVESSARPTRADELAAILAVVFLASSLLSYVAIRVARGRQSPAHKWERAADAMFLVGMVSMAGLALLFAFDNV